MADSTGQPLQCVVVTPERAVLDERADFIVLTMHDGELGILPGRSAFIGRLGFGELRLQRAGQTHRYYVDGGFGQVRADVVTILTPRAIRAEDIDVAAARAVLEAEPTPSESPADQASHRKNLERARAQIRVAGHEPGQPGH